MKKNYQITDIEIKKSNLNIVKLYLNGKLFAEIDYSVIQELDLHIGKVVSGQVLKIVEHKSKLSSAKIEAIRFLSYRPRSEWEIEKKLYDKKYQSNIIKNTINWLKEERLIDDHDFAIQWIRYQIGKKPAGRIKLRNELYKKGIDRKIIDSAVDSFFEQDADELELASQLVRKKQLSLQSKNMLLDPSKITSLLHRQGFSNTVIQRICEDFLEA
jgi:regulatory protein